MSLLLPIEAPKHWQRRRIQAVFRMYGGGTPAKENLKFWGGEIPWVSPKDMKTSFVSSTEDTITEQAVASSATRIVPEGCLLIVVRSGILKHSIPTAIASKAVSLNQDIKALVPIEPVDTRYIRYMLTGHEKLLLTVWRSLGATVESLDSERIKQSTIPLPSLSTQKAIADYLDDKTAAIDALIEKKRKLLDLLAEERAALINQAVTKGLDPTVPMKDSGIPWIGEIPAHWEVQRIASISTKITNGYVGPTRDLFVGEGIPYLQSLHIKGNTIIFSPAYHVPESWSLSKRKSILTTDDVLVVQTGDIGQVTVVPPEWEGSNCHALIIITTNKIQMLGSFLSWTLNSQYGYHSLKSIQTGALHPHLNCTLVRELRIPQPCIEEQTKISNHLDKYKNSFAKKREVVDQQINRLQEYRQALIAAAVTGQLDIEAAA
ncbi:restriction endonuclease subunit S [Marichromatium gracile]|uniref:restriction endonuclease subunit S n=1 Tax=Marichromatium gracile TaxID=1048 RepID=UPI001F3BB097|nr:restriction endonuclease subunit S [Marichromatium gracile]MCF1183659.1 restriction endonuclease subunit S [Marichromatium gracile]